MMTLRFETVFSLDFLFCIKWNRLLRFLTVAKIFVHCILQKLETLDQDSLLGLNQHGFRLDSKLLWEKNINTIISKCRSLIFALRYIRRTLSLKDTIKVFKSHVISHSKYGHNHWIICFAQVSGHSIFISSEY